MRRIKAFRSRPVRKHGCLIPSQALSSAGSWSVLPRNPLSMLNTVRREIWAVDRNVALTLTGTLKDYLKSFSYSEPRFTLILLGVFAGVGLVLVAIGVYSLIAYTVSRETHEIGIRMALGAGRSDVFQMVMRMGLRLIGLGTIAGL